jgi:hypothetical protein
LGWIWKLGLRWRAGSTAPGSARRCVPTSSEAGARRGNARRGQLLGDTGRCSGRFAGEGRAWSGGSAAAVPMARRWEVLSRGRGALARGKRWHRRFIGEALRLGVRRNGGGKHSGQELVRRRAARAWAARLDVRLPWDAVRAAWISAVARRACPPREARGLGRHGLGRRTVPGCAG